INCKGNNEAKIWVENYNSITSTFLWDRGNNVFYFGGNHSNEEFISEINKLIKQKIEKSAVKENYSHFKVHAQIALWNSYIKDIFKDYHIKDSIKLFYEYQKVKVNNDKNLLPKDITIRPIDFDLLETKKIKNVEYIKQEVEWMWPSIQRFYDNGFGFVAMHEDKAVCWCTSEYVSKKMCGIGIETISEYQNRGIATATATTFVKYCLENNIIPYWECDIDNIGSVRVAEKIDFQKASPAIFYIGKFE
ncbi:MAG: GNAT family N-acetyltransferase, partial [Candidatus Methanofastidiosia archaeon]